MDRESSVRRPLADTLMFWPTMLRMQNRSRNGWADSIAAAVAVNICVLALAGVAAQSKRPKVVLTRADVPADVIEQLNRSHNGWGLATVDADTRRTCGGAVRPPLGPAIVWADFDGDGRKDFAVRIIEGDRTLLVALLASNGSFKEVVLDDVPGRLTWTLLTVSKKGHKYFDHGTQRGGTFSNDTVQMIFCEKSAVAFIYENGMFRKVFTSD